MECQNGRSRKKHTKVFKKITRFIFCTYNIVSLLDSITGETQFCSSGQVMVLQHLNLSGLLLSQFLKNNLRDL